MEAAGRGDGDVETRRRFAAPPKFPFFFPAGEAFVAVVFVFGVWVSVSVFFLSRYYFFLLAFAYGNGDQGGEGGGCG